MRKKEENLLRQAAEADRQFKLMKGKVKGIIEKHKVIGLHQIPDEIVFTYPQGFDNKGLLKDLEKLAQEEVWLLLTTI